MAWGLGIIGDVIKTAGKAVHSGVKATAKFTGKIGKKLGDVPAIGPGLEAVFDVTVAAPFVLSDSIMSGTRIDKAALNHLKRELNNAKTLAPYVQTTVSLVPGVGTGIAGTIATGVALSEGRTIDEALMKGVKGSLPGGQVVATGLDVGYAALRGRDIKKAAIDSLQIPPQAKQALHETLRIAVQAARGQKITPPDLQATIRMLPLPNQESIKLKIKGGLKGDDLLDEVVKQGLTTVPPDVRKGLQVGMSLGHAKSLQNAVRKQAKKPATVEKLAAVGQSRVKNNEIIKEGEKSAGKGHKGFNVGMGLMTHSKVTPTAYKAVRKGLSQEDRVGFDIATALNVGLVTRVAPSGKPPALKAGYYVTMGLRKGNPKSNEAVMRQLVLNPETKVGAKIAVKESQGWLKRLLRVLGF